MLNFRESPLDDWEIKREINAFSNAGALCTLIKEHKNV
jgi:hypothetical protein